MTIPSLLRLLALASSACVAVLLPGTLGAQGLQGHAVPVPVAQGQAVLVTDVSLSPEAAFNERVSKLVAAATLPGISPVRQDARDVLFREIKPQLLAIGRPPSAAESRELLQGVVRLPCVAGKPRLAKALLHGDIAFVAVAGSAGGGCTYLLHRQGGAWKELLPLSWTLQG